MVDLSLVVYFSKDNGYEIANKGLRIVEDILDKDDFPTQSGKNVIRALSMIRDNKVEFYYEEETAEEYEEEIEIESKDSPDNQEG